MQCLDLLRNQDSIAHFVLFLRLVVNYTINVFVLNSNEEHHVLV